MLVSLEEMKLYLRVDSETEDTLILQLLESAEKVCQDVIRADEETLKKSNNAKTAIMYTTAYFTNTEKQADYKQLMLTCVVCFWDRKDGFNADS